MKKARAKFTQTTDLEVILESTGDNGLREFRRFCRIGLEVFEMLETSVDEGASRFTSKWVGERVHAGLFSYGPEVQLKRSTDSLIYFLRFEYKRGADMRRRAQISKERKTP